VVRNLVKGVEVTTIVENTATIDHPILWAQHGLSLLIKVDIGVSMLTILFDTGRSEETFLHNIETMKIDLKEVDLILISHGHLDHTAALVAALKRIGKRVPVVIHPDAFEPKLMTTPRLRYIGIPFKPSEVEAAGGVLLYTKSPITLHENVLTSGEIERSTPFEKLEGFYTLKEGQYTKDNILDDQALIIKVEGKGVVVFTGCGHSGVVNTVRQAQKLTGTKEIYAIIGGFHLLNADEERIKRTVEELFQINPKYLAPCHCTGLNATFSLLKAFEDRCKPLTTGSYLKI
jgi:7,8-dihydropterin-6-yl-methyl-4-(beta-D-ribofuranosyl)aminobenzene 5'-phosphate synthase